jgi:wyosine [tRNA(Phe)-imidazoG37] synthetase (radical SAM superfamily)
LCNFELLLKLIYGREMGDTFLFNEIVYGPVRSRRLGVSLGVNLLPETAKICSFNCIYCECGWNKKGVKAQMPNREQVRNALEKKLELMKSKDELLDVITFAGNGEPTMNKDFQGIIDDTIEVKNKYYPKAKISVLSNAVHSGKDFVRDALMKVDNRILKLDSAIDETMKLMNGPKAGVDINSIIENLKSYNGKFILQTMFLTGETSGQKIDNTTEEEVSAYLKIVEELKPEMVMIYTIARNTPEDNLNKVSLEKLNEIGDRIRKIVPDVSVSG